MSISFEDFFLWLASFRPADPVGSPGRYFNSPLALFLSARMGYVMGEDGRRYGRAAVDSFFWHELPQWAQMFARLSEFAWFSERLQSAEMTADDAVTILVQVETVLTPAPALAA